MKKRIAALLMALALSLTLLPTAAWAEEPAQAAPQAESSAPSGGKTEAPPADAEDADDANSADADGADGAVDTDSTGNADRAVTALQALIDALPDAERVAVDSADEIIDALDAVDAAKAALTDEQRAQVDFTRYDALCEALSAPAGETGAAVPMAVETTRHIYNEQLDPSKFPSGSGWSWDHENLTLTLTDIDITCALKSGSAVNLPSGNVKIVLVGKTRSAIPPESGSRTVWTPPPSPFRATAA